METQYFNPGFIGKIIGRLFKKLFLTTDLPQTIRTGVVAGPYLQDYCSLITE